MRLFITGGAGYIGSHMVQLAHQAGHEIITLDNLSTGHRDSVLYGAFELCDIMDTKKLSELFAEYKPDAVLHFAAASQVGESMLDPHKYYQNNVSGTLSLLKSMIDNSCKKLIFSSTAAIFGKVQYLPIDENHPKRPVNPYGTSKLMAEKLLRDFDSAHGLRYVALRYFNAAGHDRNGVLKERHDPETHLLPIIMEAAKGIRRSVNIFGTDYKTYDGTCIRDYVHVNDLALVHLKALEYINKEDSLSAEFNLGNGKGYSVKEVIERVKYFTKVDFDVEEKPRRKGDPPVLVASSEKVFRELGLETRFMDLDEIIKTLL